MSNPFLVALLENICESRKIPKVQVERAISPLLDIFVEDALRLFFKNDQEYSGNIVKICPEFPLKKIDETNQSTNIDWLMVNSDQNQILFVELKTSDSYVAGSFASRNNEMSKFDKYQEKRDKINLEGGGILIDELFEIANASNQPKKYAFIIEMISKYEAMIRSCDSAKIIYIVPKTSKSIALSYVEKVLTFSDFPAEIKGNYSEEWRIIQKYLRKFDERPEPDIDLIIQKDTKHRPKGYVKFDQLIQICKTKGDKVIISFTGGEEAFANESLKELKNRRHYKWDDAENVNYWTSKNWIHGDKVLKILKEQHHYHE